MKFEVAKKYKDVLAKAFDEKDENWQKEYNELKETLSTDDYANARASVYTFVLKQFDKESNPLLETEHIEFTISSPKPQGIMPCVNRF